MKRKLTLSETIKLNKRLRPQGLSHCSVCGEDKAIGEFNLRSYGAPWSWCRACFNTKQNVRSADLATSGLCRIQSCGEPKLSNSISCVHHRADQMAKINARLAVLAGRGLCAVTSCGLPVSPGRGGYCKHHADASNAFGKANRAKATANGFCPVCRKNPTVKGCGGRCEDCCAAVKERQAFRRLICKASYAQCDPAERKQIAQLYKDAGRIKREFNLNVEVDHGPDIPMHYADEHWALVPMIHRLDNLRVITTKDNDVAHLGRPVTPLSYDQLKQDPKLVAHLLRLQELGRPTIPRAGGVNYGYGLRFKSPPKFRRKDSSWPLVLPKWRVSIHGFLPLLQ